MPRYTMPALSKLTTSTDPSLAVSLSLSALIVIDGWRSTRWIGRGDGAVFERRYHVIYGSPAVAQIAPARKNGRRLQPVVAAPTTRRPFARLVRIPPPISSDVDAMQLLQAALDDGLERGRDLSVRLGDEIVCYRDVFTLVDEAWGVGPVLQWAGRL